MRHTMTRRTRHKRPARPLNMTPSSFAIRLLALALPFLAPHHRLSALGFEWSSSRTPARRGTLICSSFPPDTITDVARPAPSSHPDSDKAQEESTTPKDYFISEALFVHLGPAAQILTEAFYSHRTNFLTFQIEKLKTALSLESTYAKQNANPMGQMFVACSSRDGRVVGFAEVDTCSLKNGKCNDVDECGLPERSFDSAKRDLPRPYMYNLAVDKRWKRRGIATSLVGACERFVRTMKEEEGGLDSQWLYLRVRKSNAEAIAFYERLGYSEIDPQVMDLTKEDVNSGSAEEGELILMGKRLVS